MTDNDELVERVALAIWEHEPNCHGREFEDHSFRDKCTDQASKALSALRPGDTYNGMMWVPVELVEKMQEALRVWTAQYAPDFVAPENVERARSILADNGETLAYIADLNEMLQAAKEF